MSNITIGECVVVKSGGPVMTVEEVDDFTPQGPENGARCVWFDENKPMERIFEVQALKVHVPLTF